jgi:hypothetical protein
MVFPNRKPEALSFRRAPRPYAQIATAALNPLRSPEKSIPTKRDARFGLVNSCLRDRLYARILSNQRAREARNSVLSFSGTKRLPDQFGEEESRKRLEAALKGARLAGHQPMEDLIKKGKPPKRGRPAPEEYHEPRGFVSDLERVVQMMGGSRSCSTSSGGSPVATCGARSWTAR